MEGTVRISHCGPASVPTGPSTTKVNSPRTFCSKASSLSEKDYSGPEDAIHEAHSAYRHRLGPFFGTGRGSGSPASRNLESASPGEAILAGRAERLLSRHALRLVGHAREPRIPGP